MSRNRIFVLTDAGLITVVIGVSVSPILIVIRELHQEEDRAVKDPQILGHDIAWLQTGHTKRLSQNASTRSVSSGRTRKVC